MVSPQAPVRVGEYLRALPDYISTLSQLPETKCPKPVKLTALGVNDADSIDEPALDQDDDIQEQMNGGSLDKGNKVGGKSVRAWAEEADQGTEEGSEDEPEGEADEGEGGEGEEEEEDEYEVESIEAHKFIKGEVFYHIHWKGYPAKKDYTWEPTENLLPQARETLALYHIKIGGEPHPPQSVKKFRSTQSLRQSSTDDSPGPKRRKTDDEDTWRPKREDWEPDVDKIDAIERDDSGQLLVFVLFKNGRKLRVSMDQVYRHCPRPMLKFYENHLHFKSAVEPYP